MYKVGEKVILHALPKGHKELDCWIEDVMRPMVGLTLTVAYVRDSYCEVLEDKYAYCFRYTWLSPAPETVYRPGDRVVCVKPAYPGISTGWVPQMDVTSGHPAHITSHESFLGPDRIPAHHYRVDCSNWVYLHDWLTLVSRGNTKAAEPTKKEEAPTNWMDALYLDQLKRNKSRTAAAGPSGLLFP